MVTIKIGRMTQPLNLTRPLLTGLMNLTRALNNAGLILVNRYGPSGLDATPIIQYDLNDLRTDVLPDWTAGGIISQSRVLSAWARVLQNLAALKPLPQGKYDLGCLIRIDCARNLTPDTIRSALNIAQL